MTTRTITLDKRHSFSLTFKLIHWISALAIIGMFFLGRWMVSIDYYNSWRITAPHIHKSIGILLVLLTLYRLIYKITQPQPSIEGNRFEVIAAKIAHYFIYLDLTIMFISGYLISTADERGIDVFNWFTIPSAGQLFKGQPDIAGNIHFYAAWTLMVVVVIHILAAFKHHIINKDNTLRKII